MKKSEDTKGVKQSKDGIGSMNYYFLWYQRINRDK